MKKRTASPIALLACAAFLLTACSEGGGQEDTPMNTTSYTAMQISEAVLDSQDDLPQMYTLAPGDTEFDIYLSAYYNLDSDYLKDGVVHYAGGFSSSEVAVFEVTDLSERSTLEAILQDYIESRIAEFYGYLPEQVFLLEQAEIATSDNFIALLICEDPASARKAFVECFGEGIATASLGRYPLVSVSSVREEQPVMEQLSYDHDAILLAWQSGNYNALTQRNRDILEFAAEVIGKVTSPHMTDYEKELAIHDWMINWAEYDMEANNRAPTASPHPDNDNPYGFLFARRAICYGYSSTFQLFMDMLGIECLTVEGTSYGRNPHAWNMVKLDGQWYHVDITWNDPYGPTESNYRTSHMFLNVTDNYMDSTSHQWDESVVPSATDTSYNWD